MWKKLFAHLAQDADNEYAMIDLSIVRAHQHSAGALKKGADQAIGRSKGGLSIKIQATPQEDPFLSSTYACAGVTV